MIRETAEQRAQAIWQESLQAVPCYERRGKLIAATNALAEALVAQLAEYEIDARSGTAHEPPGSPEFGRVIALEAQFRGGDVLVPLVPGALSWQIIPAAPGGPHRRLHPHGAPIAEVTFPADAAADGWLPVSVIAAHLHAKLSGHAPTQPPQ